MPDPKAYFFTADGRCLVQSTDTREVREATIEDRRSVGRVLGIPRFQWRRWVHGGEPADG